MNQTPDLQPALRQALAMQKRGQFAEAEQRYRAIIAAHPRHLQANHLLGLMYFQAGILEPAVACLRQALRDHDDHAELHNNLGNVYRARHQWADAQAALQRAIDLNPEEARYYNDLAWCLADANDLPAARDSFEQALKLAPEQTSALVGLGCTWRDLGDSQAAIEHFQQALALQPQFPEAQLYLCQLRDHSGDAHADERVALLTSYEAAPAGSPGRRDLAFALARVSEQRGEVAQTLQFLEEAHSIQRAGQPLDSDVIDNYFAALKAAPIAEPVKVNKGPRPVFVVGLPRSGSSLIEQILASHSKVAGAGEQRLIGELCTALESEHGGAFAEAYAALDANRRQALADQYRAALAKLAPDAEFVVDKMPANFQAIGMLHSLFPDAVIIHSTRDALATCWSIYSTRFAEPHPFADTLADLGRHFRRYQQLMIHWEAKLPGVVKDVAYESLVTAAEEAIPELLALLGLEAEPACFEFHQTARPVRTASATQVRQPLYRHAMRRFEPYAEALAPLLEYIEEAA